MAPLDTRPAGLVPTTLPLGTVLLCTRAPCLTMKPSPVKMAVAWPTLSSATTGTCANRPEKSHQPPSPSPRPSATTSTTMSSRGPNSQRPRNGSRPTWWRPPPSSRSTTSVWESSCSAAVELDACPPPVGRRGRVQVQPWRLAQALDAGPHHAGQPARLGQALPDVMDRAQELARVGGAPGRIPAGGREHELVDRRRDAGRHRGRGRDIGVDVLVGDRERGVAGERQPAGEQLEQHHAGRVDVSARAGGPAGHLLRRHVRDRADEQPGPGVPGRRLRPGQAEVGHLDPAVGGQQDVLRLDVTVHDPRGVRGREPVEHAGHDLQRRRGRRTGRCP